MIIFTSICANYGHKARALAQSVHQHIPDATFYLCLTEREIPEALKKDTCFDKIVLSREIWDGNFDRFIFKHAIVEASTAVKGAFLRWLQQQHPEESMFVYLDPDCYVYGDFTELREALTRKPIVLCPHLLHPGNVDMELSSTAHGVYNLGFLAVDNSEEARRLVNWWADRLYLFCYDDIQNGVFTDQKWMDLAPCFFDVEVFRHYGYDLAPWGLLDTRIVREETGWTAQGMPLRFIHFSGFGAVAEGCMDKWLDDGNRQFRQLYDEYAAVHAACDADLISKTPWSYANYASGEPVSLTVRQHYRKDWNFMFTVEDPFALSNLHFANHFGLSSLEDMPLRRARTSLGKKLQTAWRVLRCHGVKEIVKVIREKLSR